MNASQLDLEEKDQQRNGKIEGEWLQREQVRVALSPFLTSSFPASHPLEWFCLGSIETHYGIQAILLPLMMPSLFVSAEQLDQVQSFFSTDSDRGTSAGADGHTNNWAVLVCASKFWFNYRVSRKRYLKGGDEKEKRERCSEIGRER